MKYFLFIPLALSATLCGLLSASFRNLDFESPVLPLTPGFVPLTNAFPGWRVFGGEVELREAVYNGYALSLGGLALLSFDGPARQIQSKETSPPIYTPDWCLKLVAP